MTTAHVFYSIDAETKEIFKCSGKEWRELHKSLPDDFVYSSRLVEYEADHILINVIFTGINQQSDPDKDPVVFVVTTQKNDGEPVYEGECTKEEADNILLFSNEEFINWIKLSI